MEYYCPSCRESVSIEDDSTGVETCPQCGSSLESGSEETFTYLGEESQVIGHFQLETRLGTGAYGTVWAARDQKLDRTVALKIPHAQLMSSDDQSRFLREAQSAAQLAHPNIVAIHEVGSSGEQLFIVSDLIEGEALSDRLQDRPLPRDVGVDICRTLADALHHAHEKGVIHRDLKPANILIDSGNNPFITDFGLAKRDVGDETISSEGQILGTPAYMAPEQAAGRSHAVDRRADLYSLGVILFELLTGERPFRGTSRALLRKVLHDEPPRLRSLDSSIPVDLETICLKCLEKRPEARYESAQEVCEELDRFVRKEPIKARPVNGVARGWRWLRRRPAVMAFAGGTFLGLILFATVMSVAAWAYRTQSVAATTQLEVVTEEKEKIASELEASRAEERARRAEKWARIDREIGAIESIEASLGEKAEKPQFATESTLRQFPIQGASADSWILTMSRTYEMPREMGYVAVVRDLRREYSQRGETDLRKLRLDRNADGLVDAWGSFEDGQLVLVEWDSDDIGSPNNRVNFKKKTGEEARGWFVEPDASVEPPPPPPAPLEFKAMFSAAAPVDEEFASSGPAATPWATLAKELYPDFATQADTLAQRQPLDEDVTQQARQLAELYRSNLKRFQEKAPDPASLTEGNRSKLVYVPFDLDDEPGEEAAVGFSPAGIVRIVVLEGVWPEFDKIRMEGHIADAELTRIELVDRRLFRLGNHWVELDAAARQQLTRKYLDPGLEAWKTGRWYEAIRTWRVGVRLAALCGDFRFDGSGDPLSPSTLDSDLRGRRPGPAPTALARGPWDFADRQDSAATLLQLASALVWRNRHVTRPLRVLADNATERRNFSEALRLYTLALRFADKLGEEIAKVNLLDRRSQLYSLMGSFDAALRDAERAVEAEKQIGYLAELEKSSRDLAEGSDEFALSRARDIRHHATEVNRGCRLGRIAGLHIVLRNFVEAGRSLSEAEEIFRRLGHAYGMTDVRYLRARAALEVGQLQEALTLAREALKSAEDTAQMHRLVAASVGPENPFRDGAIHQFEVHTGQIKNKVAMRSDRKYGNYSATLHLLIGDVLLALARSDELPDDAQGTDAPAATSKGDHDPVRRCIADAQRHYAEAEEGFATWGDELGLAVVRLRMATAAIEADNLETALEHCERAEQGVSSLQLQHVQWAADAVAGDALHRLGRREEAVQRLSKAAAEIEATQAGGLVPSSHTALLHHGNDVFQQLAVVKATQSQSLDVWKCFERSKQQRLNELTPLRNAQLGDASPTLPMPSLERVQAQIGDDEQLIYLWPTQSVLLAITVTHDQLTVKQLPQISSDVRSRVAELRQLIDQGDIDRPGSDYSEAYKQATQPLYEEWLRPLLLPTARRLTVIGDGCLAYLPVHAMLDDQGRYLVEKFDVGYATSGLQLARVRQLPLPDGGEPRLLLVQLNGSESAASHIPLAAPYKGNFTSLPGSDSASDSGQQDATTTIAASLLAQHLQQADILHFAGAIDLPSSRPAAAAMVLDRVWGPETPSRTASRMHLSEIARLQCKRCRLAITPSGTPLTLAGRGDELSAYVHAWNTAGVPHVLIPTWQGNARPRRDLLERLHIELARGAHPAEAWRTAQLEFLAAGKAKGFVHPRNWGGLVMFGP